MTTSELFDVKQAVMANAGIDLENITPDIMVTLMSDAFSRTTRFIEQIAVRDYGAKIHGDVVTATQRHTDIEFRSMFVAIEFSRAIQSYVNLIDIRRGGAMIRSLDDVVTLTVSTNKVDTPVNDPLLSLLK